MRGIHICMHIYTHKVARRCGSNFSPDRQPPSRRRGRILGGATAATQCHIHTIIYVLSVRMYITYVQKGKYTYTTCMYLSERQIYISLALSLSLSIYIYIYLSIHHTHICIHVFVDFSLSLYIYVCSGLANYIYI